MFSLNFCGHSGVYISGVGLHLAGLVWLNTLANTASVTQVYCMCVSNLSSVNVFFLKGVPRVSTGGIWKKRGGIYEVHILDCKIGHAALVTFYFYK